MEMEFIERVYLTVTGDLVEEYRVPGVEDLFAPGKSCERLYNQMMDAYERLVERLGGKEEDPDAEIMVDATLQLCEKVGYAMYRYGALFGDREQ